MPILLSDQQIARVRSLMQTGQFADDSAIFDAALDLLERRLEFRALIQEGIDAVERGEVVDHETVFRDVRQRIAEIAARQQPAVTH